MERPGAEDVDLLVAAAREAGALALTFFRRNLKTWTKAGNAIVSEADMALDGLLTERLRAARPDYGWLSEETVDNPDRLTRHRVFVVDPIDGTRAFLSGGNEWTVSLAVVADGRPIAAALFAPVMDEMFRGVAGGGADRNGGALSVSGSDLSHARFAGPKRYARPVLEAAGIPAKSVRFVPSLAYRLALVATGQIDVAISGPNANDWDLAAADLLVHEAGGTVADLSGRRPRYNNETVTHPLLIAAPPALAREAASLIAGEIGVDGAMRGAREEAGR